MIPRYTRPEMGNLWSLESRFSCLLEVEIAVAKRQAELDLIPAKAYKDIRAKARFDVDRIAAIEKETKHDVIAFVTNVAENVGPSGRYIHYGMTSSDVLDTSLSVQVGKASVVLFKGFDRLEKALEKIAQEHQDTLCAGRTHGMHAEATTFGYKMAGHLMEIRRTRARVERAVEQMLICKLSGAVGTYSTQSPEVESGVAKELGLQTEAVATQVIPRDRHAEMMWSLAMTGAALERLAVELRHLQRTEVGEVVEGFTPGQKGSSAMPHKKNPISAENLTGLSRILRANAHAAMEDIALWHERDISHSSVERVIFPDSFILADYALHRMADLVAGLFVDKSRMLRNMELSQGQLFSSQVLLHLIDRGLTREQAYKVVQRVCHDLEPGDTLESRLLSDPETRKLLEPTQLRQIFSGASQRKMIGKALKNGKTKGPTSLRRKSQKTL
ncbi:MAG: adenylosuccinate lyase [Bdellovibrionales bacterium]